jgi:quercetin dioxygenase-like cupin family protein
MRKLPGLSTVFAAAAVLATVNAASATPPSGDFSYTEHGRVQQSGNATLTIPASDNLESSYTMAAGGDTGWRTAAGDVVIAVFKGALTVDQAQGCASQEVAAGRAVAVPPGKFRLRSAGNQPAQFSGVFFNLPVGGPDPLVASEAEPAPACAGVSAAAVVPSGVSAADSARGVITAGKYHGADPSGTVVHSLDAGKDMFVGSYTLEPGFSTGWIVHTDELVILTKGKLAIWEARDGKCAKVEEYSAGQAWAHKPHRHMGVNEGTESAVARVVGFNMKHGDPMPIVGSNPDHFDFTQLPPSDCPRVR